MDCDEDRPDPWAAPSVMSAPRRWSAGIKPATNGLGVVKRITKRRKRTSGKPSNAGDCYVYAAQRGGLVKIGVTGNLPQRMRDIGAHLILCIPVVHVAARDVEGMALTLLGRQHDDPGEWVSVSSEKAKAALYDAWAAVGRYRRVDPDLTEDEARQQRVAAASKKSS